MKKIIYVLFFAMCFSCEKECDSTDNSSNNSGNNLPPQNCGTVTMDVNYLTSESFNSNQYEVECNSSITKYNGSVTQVDLEFWFKCNTVVPGTNTNTTVPIRYIVLNSYVNSSATTCLYYANYCDFGNSNFYSTSYNSNPQSSSPDSITINLTNIDEVNYKLSGDFTVIDPSGNTPNIDVVFLDIPISISSK